jgi:hypothetical protein
MFGEDALSGHLLRMLLETLDAEELRPNGVRRVRQRSRREDARSQVAENGGSQPRHIGGPSPTRRMTEYPATSLGIRRATRGDSPAAPVPGPSTPGGRFKQVSRSLGSRPSRTKRDRAGAPVGMSLRWGGALLPRSRARRRFVGSPMVASCPARDTLHRTACFAEFGGAIRESDGDLQVANLGNGSADVPIEQERELR